MFYVYILISKSKKNWIYVGFTNNLRRRLIEHKNGSNKSTKLYLPLELNAYIALNSELKAKKIREISEGWIW